MREVNVEYEERIAAQSKIQMRGAELFLSTFTQYTQFTIKRKPIILFHELNWVGVLINLQI